jgi:hypothetical protein
MSANYADEMPEEIKAVADDAEGEGVYASVLNILTFEGEEPADATDVRGIALDAARNLMELAREATEYADRLMEIARD